MTDLSDRQAIVLAAVRAYYERHGVAPTHRELGRQLGLSISTIHQHLRSLLRKGKVKAAGSRGYIPLAQEDQLVKFGGGWSR